MSETKILNDIRNALGRLRNVRLFRNQVGVYVLPDGRVIRSGFCNGSGDLLGWKTVRITPDMVGQNVAVFLSVEVKAPKGRVDAAQLTWASAVQEAGGIAGFARSVDEAMGIINAGS